MKILKNKLTIIEYNEKQKEISGRCLQDDINYPAFYNRNIRSIKKGWEALEAKFNKNISMYDAMNILDKYNLKCRSWCMMD